MRPASAQQFRMRRLQVYNWGTFSDLHDIPIAQRGFLFVGQSGSGKSTLLDAFSALLVPPRWLSFNAAAAEADRTGRDRSLVSYVRGAWAEQKGEAGEIAMQFLRSNTTWSALALTLQNELNQIVVLVRLFWLRGSANSNADVHKHYLIFERPFDLQELRGFSLDIRKLKHELPDAFERSEFAPYCERFRRLLGIESEMALRLLHKTQSAKNLGDLNVLLREFMLDRPETFEVADRLVKEFAELNAAHQAVVTAREQIQTLSPARDNHRLLDECRQRRAALNELILGVDAYRESKHLELLRTQLTELRTRQEGLLGEVAGRKVRVENHKAALIDLEREHRNLGGDRIEQWQREKAELETQLESRGLKRTQADEACRKLQWRLPDTPQGFAERTSAARVEMEQWQQQTQAIRQKFAELSARRAKLQGECAAAAREVEVLKRRPSNIPSHMHELRTEIARTLQIAESELPFAGELIDVNPRDAQWRGAIERVLRGFALSLLVHERDYSALSAHLNATALAGRRLVYYRVSPSEVPGKRSVDQQSLCRKLHIQPGDFATWLEAELSQRFDYACAESMQAFRSTERAVTRVGQIRHGKARHEKDDRLDLNDPRNWVLGFSNQEKLESYTRLAHDLAEQLNQVESEIKALNDQDTRHNERAMACQTLVNIRWQEIDLTPLIDRIDALTRQLGLALAENAPLHEIARRYGLEKKSLSDAEESLREADVQARQVTQQIDATTKEIDGLQTAEGSLELSPLQRDGLDARVTVLNKALTLANLEQQFRAVERGINAEIAECSDQANELERAIEASFADFKTRWPVDAGDMDTTVASAPDFLARLHRLETDGLPTHEHRFFDLLRNQSHQNLAALSKTLLLAHRTIVERMDEVNSSLSYANFNPGTFLKIDVNDRQLEDVRNFKQEIEQALRHAWTDDREAAEARFRILRALVDRLASQEPDKRTWREAMLDVRQHVEFVAREVDGDGKDLEIYRSGAGKSGGQRQKLATTCLAAALRYQLSNEEHDYPLYAPVVLDEAFEKADNEFTTLAMNIFVQFGFQMIVATPLKAVMTLEPFIGGACFVEIRERRHSALLMIEYDDAGRRLKLPEQVARTAEVVAP